MRTTADPRQFETFYADVRGRLLLQTWALTGDLPAAQRAVRDTMVIAWHHWAKLSRLQEPESWARPQAYAHALRRHTVRPLHREKNIDPGVRATLAALAKLPLVQRKVLLLAHLTTLPLDQLAREVGVPQAVAERELQSATAAFSLHRDVPTTAILALFEPMLTEVEQVRWPRPTIITRAGSTRRRAHTAVGALLAVATLVVAGTAVSDPGGVRPELDALSFNVERPHPIQPERSYPLTSETLLTERQFASKLPERWSTEMTSDNTGGDGLVLPCQEERYADAKARSTLMRVFAGPRGVSGGQATEAAASTQAAQVSYNASLGWYAGCQQDRVQLVSTRRVSGVGDAASLVVLRDWDAPVRQIVVSVARTGVLTTTVASSLPLGRRGAVTGNLQLLATAVRQVCRLPDAGRCASEPKMTEVPPLPTGPNPGMLSEVDLPPIAGVDHPWAGTQPAPATSNLAATRCDATKFHVRGVRRDLTRTFVIPEATQLPPQFGLTQTVGILGSEAKAQAFLRDVNATLDACPDKDLGVTVRRVESFREAHRSVTVWRVEEEISDAESVVYLMALVRQGDAVGQLGFVPSGTYRISADDFAALAHRAGDRLARLR